MKPQKYVEVKLTDGIEMINAVHGYNPDGITKNIVIRHGNNYFGSYSNNEIYNGKRGIIKIFTYEYLNKPFRDSDHLNDRWDSVKIETNRFSVYIATIIHESFESLYHSLTETGLQESHEKSSGDNSSHIFAVKKEIITLEYLIEDNIGDTAYFAFRRNSRMRYLKRHSIPI